MTVEWGGYEPFDPGVTQPLHELPKREARAAFDRLMTAKDDRIEALRRFLGANGVTLLASDEHVQDLNDWFRQEVEGDAATGRLRPIWYSVVNDIGLFLGDLMIARNPNLRWTFFDKGSKDVAFQRHVIMGFTKVANPKYNIDVDRLVATYGHQLVAGQDVESNLFWQWLRAADARA